MNDRAGATDLADDFVRINEFLRSGGQQAAALQRLIDLAVATVPGCDWAAITAWPRDRRPRSIAFSADEALTADHIQYAVGDGPCLSAAASDTTVHLADVHSDDRWPQFRAALSQRSPVQSLLSFQLNQEPERTALNLYSARPAAYDATAVAAATLFAAHARVLLMHAESAVRATHLDHALTTSRHINTAVGILMQLHKITADDAFALLRTTSQHLNRKLALIAEDVNRTGTLPDR